MMKNKFVVSALMLSASLIGFPTYAEQIPLKLLGDPVPTTNVDRTIVIRPDTKHVNVIGGETIKFVVGEKTFAWRFSGGVTAQSFDLTRIAPPGVLDHSVIAYVETNPLYRNR
jgi:hypothetical protein